MSTKVRNSNLELLRILSMFFIIAHHYAIHGFNMPELSYSFNRYIIGTLSLGGKLGVDCFVLISGYYICTSKFSLQKFIKLSGEVWFYSIIIGLLFLFVLTPVEPLGITNYLQMILPIGYGAYWFITDFIMLMLFSPILNLFISKSDRITHRNFIFLFIFLWSIMPSFFFTKYSFTSFGWFIILYLIAGYIRKYNLLEKRSPKKHILTAAAAYGIVILSNITMLFLGHTLSLDVLTRYSGHFLDLNSIFILIASVELLLGFLKFKPHFNSCINLLASATLGVYLIHDNSLFRPYLWHVLLKNDAMYSSSFLILHALISIIGVWVICTIIDLIRQKSIEKIFLSSVQKISVSAPIFKIKEKFFT